MNKKIRRNKKEKVTVHAIYYKNAEEEIKKTDPAKTERFPVWKALKATGKKAAWIFWHMLLFGLAGGLVTILWNDSTRKILFEMLSL